MIYLDYNATTPVLPEVHKEMEPYFLEKWGNPSSIYRFGSSIRKVLEVARENVASLIDAQLEEIYFTSCATESNNTAIHAAVLSNPEKRHIITSQVEHLSVINYCKVLENQGYSVTYLPVDKGGGLDVTDLENAINEQTVIVSLMWANNETGVLFPIEDIAAICRSRGVLFHCDAVQAVGKASIDIKKIGVDYMSITGHKIYAPKGIGALFVRNRKPISPLIVGGHQERGVRGGTENVPLIVGLGKAAEIARKNLGAYDKVVSENRNALENGILSSVPNTELNGRKEKRLANTTNIAFYGIEAEALLLLLDEQGVCASSGSACLVDRDEPSHVIKAMKHSDTLAQQSIRFSLGLQTNQNDIEYAILAIRKAVDYCRG